MKIVKKTIVLIMCMVMAATFICCDGNKKKGNNMVIDGIDFGIEGNEGTITGFEVSKDTNPLVAIYVEGYGVMVIELYPDIAPNTVNNFISLAKSGFYDGLIFHRIIENFMIQGGDPRGTGVGGPGYAIAGEFNINGFQNNLKHTKGVISMARAKANDTAGSQFFIVHKKYPSLDGQYAAFGMTVSGLEVLDKIATVETGKNDRPKKDVVMTKVIVDTKGVEYPEPIKVGE